MLAYHVFALHLVISVLLHILSLQSLSFLLSSKWHDILKAKSKSAKTQQSPTLSISPKSAPVLLTRLLGFLAAATTATVSLSYPTNNPLVHVTLRVTSFFFTAKLLDLAVARTLTPPIQLSPTGTPIPLNSPSSRITYVLLLLTECRYHSFTNSIQGRKIGQPLPPLRKSSFPFQPISHLLAPPLLAILLPCAESYVLLGLLLISLFLEVVHSLLHPKCPYPLFDRPFDAGTLTEFWGRRWQQAAAPFLRSLAYEPAKDFSAKLVGRRAGRAVGVLAAFALSGIWHGWCAAALSNQPWRAGVGLLGVFAANGVGVVLEGMIGGKGWKGNWWYKWVIWMVTLWVVGCWVRVAVPTARFEGVVRRWEGR